MPVPASKPSARRKKPDPVSREPERAAVTSAARAAALHAAAASQRADGARAQRVAEVATWAKAVPRIAARMRDAGLMSDTTARQLQQRIGNLITTDSVEGCIALLLVFRDQLEQPDLLDTYRARYPGRGAEGLTAIHVEIEATLAGLGFVPTPDALDTPRQESAPAVHISPAMLDPDKWTPIATTHEGRRTRRASDDLRLLRKAAEDAGLSQRLADVLEGRVPLSKALPKKRFKDLRSPPVLSVPKPLPASYRWPLQAANGRKILTCICKSYGVPDHDRASAVVWLVRGLREGLAETEGQRTAV